MPDDYILFGGMVEEVMCAVVTNIAKYPSTKDRSSNVPVPIEDCMREFPERSGKYEEERWWHNQPVPVHW